jgi:hypothetical protein
VSGSRLGRSRRGLGLSPFSWAILAILSCLNPRPDDQPLFSGETDSDGSNSSPPVIDRGDGLGLGDGTGGSDPGSDGSPASGPDNTDTPAAPGGSAADAGPPPDAGPLEQPDAGVPND